MSLPAAIGGEAIPSSRRRGDVIPLLGGTQTPAGFHLMTHPRDHALRGHAPGTLLRPHRQGATDLPS
jgi:hypothetical protein